MKKRNHTKQLVGTQNSWQLDTSPPERLPNKHGSSASGLANQARRFQKAKQP